MSYGLPLRVAKRMLVALSATMFATLAMADFQSGIEAFKRNEFVQAEREWTAAALAGDVRALYQLGVMLLHGKRIRQDASRAQVLFQDAASRGSSDAVYALYVAAAGDGRLRLSELARLLETAAERGSIRAGIDLASPRLPMFRFGSAGIQAEDDYSTRYVAALDDSRIRLSEALVILEEGAYRGSRPAASHLDAIRAFHFSPRVSRLAVEQEGWAPIGFDTMAPASSTRGAAIYQQVCTVCHETGVAGAPRRADRDRWKSLESKGLETLTKNAIRGIGAHPPNGVSFDFPDSDIRDAVHYMLGRD